MKRFGASLSTAAMIIIAAVFSAPSASAADAPVVRDDVAAVMDAVSGGVLIDADHAIWPSIGMEMTSAEAAGVFSVGSCATDSVCAFSGANLSGSKLSWSTCNTFSISAFTVHSIADARSTGYLQARNGTAAVATANAGASANVFGTVTNVRCVS